LQKFAVWEWPWKCQIQIIRGIVAENGRVETGFFGNRLKSHGMALGIACFIGNFENIQTYYIL